MLKNVLRLNLVKEACQGHDKKMHFFVVMFCEKYLGTTLMYIPQKAGA